MPIRPRYQTLRTYLAASSVLVGLITLGLIAYIAMPYVQAAPEKPTGLAFEVPAYDYEAWANWAVQDGRVKPFETAAREAMRAISGRGKFSALPDMKPVDAVPVMLMWMMTNGAGSGTAFPSWDEVPFILCDHHEVRKWIYAHTALQRPDLTADEMTPELVAEAEAAMSDDQKHGKFVTPAEVRASPGFESLINKVRTKRAKYADKASQFYESEERKAEEVYRRLTTYDEISQNDLVNRKREGAELVSAQTMLRGSDPFKIVSLDRVPGAAWFSIGDLKILRDNPSLWTQKGKDRDAFLPPRMKEMPQNYVAPEQLAELSKFQELVREGKGTNAVEELGKSIAAAINESVASMIASKQLDPMKAEQMRDGINQRIQQTVSDLRRRVEEAVREGYDPADPKFMMLHLDYLEARFPSLYEDAAKWQEYPAARVEAVLNAFEAVQVAYKSLDPAKFNEASQAFFTIVHNVSDDALIEGLASRPDESVKKAEEQYKKDGNKDAFFAAAEAAGLPVHRYPGSTTLDIERSLNKVQPFMWAWVVMFFATIAFTLSYASGSKFFYAAGFTLFGLSLLAQVYGFYCRVAIAGRAPVSNMYETVIFVAFMSAIFAMVLELVYRKGVIAIAGSLVATIGLVLADQIPVVLDPKISPLVPVLRSNFWLTIHVLTIVSSYAGGTLAWGLANVTLFLLLFSKPDRETLKTLSSFTYRAMQIAVLLLAAGTFLGGWWAAYSWGRFWGWDPKETWALISLVCYVIPLHMRYIGWVKDFGLAVSAVVCYAAILMCWYGVNFVLGAGLHSYGFGGGGPYWVLLAGLLNMLWVNIAAMLYLRKLDRAEMGSVDADAIEREPVEV